MIRVIHPSMHNIKHLMKPEITQTLRKKSKAPHPYISNSIRKVKDKLTTRQTSVSPDQRNT